MNALAHITGGSFNDNIKRILPENLTANIEIGSWTPKPVFEWLAKTGEIAEQEMIRTFNCGIGMAVIVSPTNVDEIMLSLRNSGEEVYKIGKVTRQLDNRRVILDDLKDLWAA